MGASVLALRVFGVDELRFPCKKCGAVRKWSDMRDGCHHYDSLTKKTVPVHIVTDPDGFCAWAERKEVTR